eukprot:c19061_g1_i1.p1 GENE.c19061_g1_i1~~c19061_g1_i1.p1  ORF type:complete len:283 (+),score=48.23 c19061_g1_i1:12-860(+)
MNPPPRILQLHYWDCGPTCLEMVINAVLESPCQDLRSQILAICNTQSVWTIDLAYVLAQLGFSATFFTIRPRPAVEYQQMSYYSRNFVSDSQRVNHIVDNADKFGLVIREQHLSISDISTFLCHQSLSTAMQPSQGSNDQQDCALVIILLNRELLYSVKQTDQTDQDLFCGNRALLSLQQCLNSLCSSSGHTKLNNHYNNDDSKADVPYLGHFVVVHAYDPHTNCFLINDPNSPRCTHVVPADELDAARLCKGTDEDFIVVPRKQTCRCIQPASRSTNSRRK